MAFDASKREILHKLQQVIDKSPKGSVDAPIVDMIERLNAHPDFVTCSSCSGRIAVFCGVAQSEDEDSHLITKGGKWLVSSHAPVSFEEFHDSVLADPAILQGLVIFKHEPFIMHVQCRDENAARVLLQCGLACGFRESGIVLGNKRTMVAIRTTANAMEIPIAHQGKLMVDTAYLKWILDIANEKFHANRVKTDKLFAAMLTTLFQPTATNLTSIAAGSMPSLSVSRVGHASVIRTKITVEMKFTQLLGENRVFIIGGQGPTATNTGRLSDLVLLDTDGKANGQYFTVPVFDNIKAQVPPALKEYSITPVQLATAPPSHEDEVTSIAQPDAAVQPEDGAANLENVESPKIDEPLFAVVVGKDQVKTIKTHLELLSLYDKSRRIHPHDSDGLFAVPVLTSSFPLSDPIIGELEVILNTSCEVKPVLNPAVVVLDLLKSFATRHDLASVPTKIEFVADVLVLPKNTCLEPAWNSEDATQLWQDVCEKSPISVKRIARSADVDLSEKRQSHVELLYVHLSFVVPTRGVGWVEVRENGLKYAWDIQKVMFSSGNVTEKARMAKIGCAGETIVDMYAGIGYYVIPFLVHGKAAHVHALEWNPDSVDALRYNLERNRVSSRCTVYPGDNRISGPTLGAIADRVNLGLLPKSEHGWPVAVQVLKPSGGWLHVHENVAVEDITAWQEHVVKSIQELGRSIGKHWKVECAHLERVKSYAPKVYHLVADIHCTPLET
ncbi:unnamed protein product [Aphanomyces euteiches]